MFAHGKYLVMTLAGAASLTALAAPADSVRNTAFTASRAVAAGASMTVPLTSWPVDTKSFIAQHRTVAKGNLKAATDRATVYRPVPVCRLVDTRGFPAGVNIAGPLAGGSTTNVNSAGVCGIPTTGVAGLSVSFHVFNFTNQNGGFIAFLQQGAPISGVNAVFNTGADWTAATANVSLPDDSGNFEIFIAQSTVHVIVDVNGYYQDLDNVDVGSQEFDIVGNTVGDTFEVSNFGSGSALSGSNFGGGAALRLNSGSFAVGGAGINSGTTAFIFEVGGTTACAAINHPMLNGDSSALVLVTPREGTPTSIGGTAPATVAVAAAYNVCGGGVWGIRGITGALPARSQYSVFIIKAQ
jgi:hypothetical protein